MNEETVVASFYQKLEGEEEPMHMTAHAPVRLLNKMAEILKRDPEGTWTNRDLDLAKKANEELEAEKAQKQPQSEEQPSEPLSISQPMSEGLEQ